MNTYTTTTAKTPTADEIIATCKEFSARFPKPKSIWDDVLKMEPMFEPFGLRVYVAAELCRMEFVRWRKSHRKSRINKKWHKKYGAIHRCANTEGIRMGDSLHVCPCVKAKMDRIFVRQQLFVPVQNSFLMTASV